MPCDSVSIFNGYALSFSTAAPSVCNADARRFVEQKGDGGSQKPGSSGFLKDRELKAGAWTETSEETNDARAFAASNGIPRFLLKLLLRTCGLQLAFVDSEARDLGI